MIFVVEDKRLNDFKYVHCVKPKDLFSRLGHRVPNTDFNSSDEPIPMHMSKIQSIEYLERYDRMMQESSKPNESQSNEAPDDSTGGE